jgi:hypothetical protein
VFERQGASGGVPQGNGWQELTPAHKLVGQSPPSPRSVSQLAVSSAGTLWALSEGALWCLPSGPEVGPYIYRYSCSLCPLR